MDSQSDDENKHPVIELGTSKHEALARYRKVRKHNTFDDDRDCKCLESYCCEHIFMEVICGCICEKMPSLWKQYNKCCFSMSYLIILTSVFMLMYITSNNLYQSVNDSFDCEFCGYNYTTCFIANDTFNSTTVNLIYGVSNQDWGNMNKTIKVTRLQSGFQTCLYNSEPSSSLTVIDYNQFGTSTASYLWSDDKFLWINCIVFSAFFILFCCIVGCFWVCNGFPTIGMNKGCVLLGLVGGAVLMIVGWPCMIMASIVIDDMSDYSHTASQKIYDEFDCVITNIHDIRFFELNCQNETICNIKSSMFGIVEYAVSMNNESLLAVDIIYDVIAEDVAYLNEDYERFYNVINETEIDQHLLQQIKPKNVVTKCYQNIDSKQVILDEYPSTFWLEPPINNVVVIWIIVLGVLLICLPCTLLIFLVIGWIGNGCPL